MSEKPILFFAPMVRALLAGTKTQTRRIMKLPHGLWETSPGGDLAPIPVGCRYGQPGDRLWVRESFQALFADGIEDQYQTNYKTGKGYKVYYMATDARQEYVDADDDLQDKITPSIFMPRWASRITLEITKVRCERLQDISNEDAEQEGVRCDMSARTFRDHYSILWERINGKGSWAANPWIWALTFKRIEP